MIVAINFCPLLRGLNEFIIVYNLNLGITVGTREFAYSSQMFSRLYFLEKEDQFPVILFTSVYMLHQFSSVVQSSDFLVYSHESRETLVFSLKFIAPSSLRLVHRSKIISSHPFFVAPFFALSSQIRAFPMALHMRWPVLEFSLASFLRGSSHPSDRTG